MVALAPCYNISICTLWVYCYLFAEVWVYFVEINALFSIAAQASEIFRMNQKVLKKCMRYALMLANLNKNEEQILGFLSVSMKPVVDGFW